MPLAALPHAAEDGHDPDFVRRLTQRICPPIARAFRLQISGAENIRGGQPGILAINHNVGMWGVLDVLLAYYSFYKYFSPDDVRLSGMTVERTFDIPVMGYVATKMGLRPPTPANLASCLEQGHWVLLAPGGDTDVRRPIWMKNRVRFKKTIFVNGNRVLRDNFWYLDAALARGVPVYPVIISGTHDMTPILWESVWLYRYTGLKRLYGDEAWPGFSFTLNHLVNAGALALSPFGASPLAWLAFALLNIYVEFVYMYPLFPFQIKIHFGEPVRGVYQEGMTLAERQRAQRETNEKLVTFFNANLRRLDSERWWVRAFAAGRRALGLSKDGSTQ